LKAQLPPDARACFLKRWTPVWAGRQRRERTKQLKGKPRRTTPRFLYSLGKCYPIFWFSYPDKKDWVRKHEARRVPGKRGERAQITRKTQKRYSDTLLHQKLGGHVRSELKKDEEKEARVGQRRKSNVGCLTKEKIGIKEGIRSRSALQGW